MSDLFYYFFATFFLVFGAVVGLGAGLLVIFLLSEKCHLIAQNMKRGAK